MAIRITAGGSDARSYPRAGRPRDAAKRDAILDAAHALFFARGVEATTIEDIATAAGVSKVTIYGHFGDKPTLFEACVRRAVARMEQGLIGPRPRGETLAERLRAMGVSLLAFLTSEPMVSFDRAFAAEASRHPELAERFFQAGPGHCRARLAEVIATGAAAGEVLADDPAKQAEELMGLWYGFLHKELSIGRTAPPTPAEIDARVQRGVGVFLRAYAPKTEDRR